METISHPAGKKIFAEKPVNIAGLTLIPVVKVLWGCPGNGRGFSCFALKKPVAIAVISPTLRKAFRVTGEEISIDELASDFPEVRDALSGSSP